MLNTENLPATLTSKQARKLYGEVGENRWNRMLQRREFPGILDISLGNKPVYRVKTRVFLDWLEGKTDNNPGGAGVA